MQSILDVGIIFDCERCPDCPRFHDGYADGWCDEIDIPVFSLRIDKTNRKGIPENCPKIDRAAAEQVKKTWNATDYQTEIIKVEYWGSLSNETVDEDRIEKEVNE